MSQRDHPGSCGWGPNVITSVLTKGRQREKCTEGNVTTEQDAVVLASHMKEGAPGKGCRE